MNAKKRTLALVAEIDRAELTVRLLEIGCRMKRPPGKSAAEALMDTKVATARGEIPAHIVGDFEAMADAAVRYIAECINAGKRPQ